MPRTPRISTRPTKGLSDAPGGYSLDLASKLGHLCTADDPQVQEMLRAFQEVAPGEDDGPAASVRVLDTTGVAPLEAVIAVGGSLTSIPNAMAPQKVIGYVKLAAVYVDGQEVERLKAPVVNPESVRRVLSARADTQATATPLGNVRIPGQTLLQTLRHTLQATFERFAGGAVYDTLEYLVSCGWDADAEPWRAGSRNQPQLVCPLCEGRVHFPRYTRSFRCRACGQPLTLVDYLGLLTDASESSSDSAVAMNLSGVLQHLLLLTFLRRVIDRGLGGRILLMRDGPLMLRGQCTRLADLVRGYLRFLRESGATFHLAGVEREGAFVSHCRHIEAWFKEKGEGAVFVPDNRYVLERVKHSGGAATVYGRKGLYGSKLFYRVDGASTLVLSAPNRRHGFDAFAADPTIEDLVGLDPIAATLKGMVSRHFPGVPLPLTAVDRLCSLPHYPMNDLLGLLDGLPQSR